METANAYEEEYEFPNDVGDHPEDIQEQSPNKPRKNGFTNTIKHNDAITVCDGFVHECKEYNNGDSMLYFLRVGLLNGSQKDKDDVWTDRIVNCDLLAGPTITKWCSHIVSTDSTPTKMRLRFTIKNLRFFPEIYNEKPVLRSKGTLETIEIGHIDRG